MGKAVTASQPISPNLETYCVWEYQREDSEDSDERVHEERNTWSEEQSGSQQQL